jgi:hypothetical protein
VVEVRIDVHQGAMFNLLRSPSGPVHRRVSSVRRKTEAIAVANAPVGDTGNLRNERTSETRDETTRLVAEITFHAYYALFVMKGTGIYGPKGQPIRPKTAEYLVFRGRDGGLVYVKQVRGQRPNPFLVEALKTASPWPVIVH